MRTFNSLPALLAALCLGGTGAAAGAGGPLIEFVCPSEGHRPQIITVGPDGNLWATDSLKHTILRITPKGRITPFAVPGAKVGVLLGIAGGPDGNSWFTEQANRIGRIDIKALSR
jgi:virginiamycin B lyase